MTAAQQPYPETHITRSNRVSSQHPCKWCGSDKYCLRFERGDSFCKNIGDDSEWTDKFLGGYLHKAENPQPWPHHSPVQSQDKADPHILNAVYEALLGACPLSVEDRNYLRSCQLTDTDADRGFGTLPPKHEQRAIITKLVLTFGYEVLRTVPGFTVDDGDLLLNGAGLLVAIRDVQGQIVGFQVRYGSSNYRWLSGGTGPTSGAPAHVAVPLAQVDNRIYVVESPKTANILAARIKACVIGIAGHSNYRAVLPVLQHLVEHNDAAELVILFDQDPDQETAERVERSRQALACDAVPLGYAVRIGRWEQAQGKGPDDLLLAGGHFTCDVYRYTQDTITAENHVLRAKYEQSEQWRRFMVRIAANDCVAGDAETGLPIYGEGKSGRPKPALTPSDRIIAINTALTAMRVPEVDCGDQPRFVKVSQQRVASMAGVSAGTVSRSWQHLANLQIFEKKVEQKSRTDRQVLFAAGQLPPPGAVLLESKPRAKDRNRRCASCGSTHIKQRTKICVECGEISNKASNVQDTVVAGRKRRPIRSRRKENGEILHSFPPPLPATIFISQQADAESSYSNLRNRCAESA